jgi:hypothetical protein
MDEGQGNTMKKALVDQVREDLGFVELTCKDRQNPDQTAMFPDPQPQQLTLEDEERKMKIHVYLNGKHTTLQASVEDLEQFIFRCGWTIVNDIEGLTPQGKAEIERLESLPFITMPTQDSQTALAWWNERVISQEPALTPDM